MKTKLLLILAPFFLPLAALHAQSNYATPYTFTTFAGVASGAGAVDGTGSSARFNHPSSLAVDGSGNIYVADTNNDTVRKVTGAGVVTTFAGLAGSVGSADGTGSAARFSAPNGAAMDGAGNIYVADTSNHTIRKITPGGVVTTLAGTPGSIGSADGTGAAAQFNSPFAVTVDGAGNVYVADTYNSTIRKITPGGVVTTLAGLGGPGNNGTVDGTGSAARFNFPTGLTADGAGNIYVADTYNSTIRKVTSAGVVTTLAGTALSTGSTDATGSAARFNNPYSVAVDGSGNLFVADSYNHTIRKVTTAGGVVTTLAGSAGSPGSANGTGSAARFYTPSGVAVDGAGNVYVSDTSNDTIRKITSGGVVTTLAGGAVYQSADGLGSAARFAFPYGVTTDAAGNIYVADAGNSTIRKITPSGSVTTLAGTALSTGSTDGTGASARFNTPLGVAVDGSGNVYVADSVNNTVRKVTAGGVVTTLAGMAGVSPGSVDGTGTAARFNSPSGVAVDGAGNVYVADTANNTVRKITAGGVVTTFAGMAGVGPGSVDGTGGAARFYSPFGVAVDGSGNLYVTDTGNNTVRKITSGGVVTTLAGTASTVGSTDGTGSAARFNGPRGVAVDATGNVYVANFNNFTIRKISPAGVVTTLAGTPGVIGSINGTGRAARFNYPTGVAVASSGELYVADFGNNTIRRGIDGGPGMVNDFNGDGQPDILWENTVTGQRGFWLMNGTTASSWVDLANVATDWRIAAVADFNGDGKPDILWENTVTGQRGFWLMNGTTPSSWVDLGNVATDWRIAAVADFDGDGKPDILWENTVTGQRGFWLMNGTTASSWVDLANVATDWRIAAVADFDGDGKPDILWENTVTGQRGFWLMNGTTASSWVDLANVATDWRIAAVADFDGDGKPDILWENTVTGDRGFWLMSGTTASSWVYLANAARVWRIAP